MSINVYEYSIIFDPHRKPVRSSKEILSSSSAEEENCGNTVQLEKEDFTDDEDNSTETQSRSRFRPSQKCIPYRRNGNLYRVKCFLAMGLSLTSKIPFPLSSHVITLTDTLNLETALSLI